MCPRGVRPSLLFAAAVLTAFASFPIPLSAQRGALVQARNLGELVSQSTTIVRGSILDAKVEPHPELNNLWTVVVTLRVQETLKGDTGKTLTFRQFIWDVRDRYDAAGYRKGQELLLLLNPVTRYGLTSPAGLDQGRFVIARDFMGREVAVNGRGNAGLFRGLGQEVKSKRLKVAPNLAALIDRQTVGPIPVQDLRDLVRNLSASQ